MINPILEIQLRQCRQALPTDLQFDPSLRPRLPLLVCLERSLGPVDQSIVGLFGLQHLLGSTASLIDTIARGRLTPTSVFLLGKPYSASRKVVDFLAAGRGYRVYRQSLEQPLERPNDDQIDHAIKSAFKDCRRWWQDRAELVDPRKTLERMLLIDDGGRAIRLLHAPEFEDICGRFTCVEQTRAGIRALEDLDLRIPVVNVAESWVKLEHESRMIAASVCFELDRQLVAMERACIPTGQNALIIGYGAIGQAVGKELQRQGRNVSVYDTQPQRRVLAARDGFPLHDNLHAALAQGGLIIGCTGKPVLDYPDYGHIPDGAILVSASSADNEFRGWQLRPQAVSLGRPRAWRNSGRRSGGELYDRWALMDTETDPCFCLYLVRWEGRSFYLVNGGFPVNFTGEIDPISPDKIQLTRGLLYCGAVQASRSFMPGLQPLDGRMQRQLLEEYLRLTGEHSGGILCSYQC